METIRRRCAENAVVKTDPAGIASSTVEVDCRIDGMVAGYGVRRGRLRRQCRSHRIDVRGLTAFPRPPPLASQPSATSPIRGDHDASRLFDSRHKRFDEDLRIIEGMATTPNTDRAGDVIEPMGKFITPMPSCGSTRRTSCRHSWRWLSRQ